MIADVLTVIVVGATVTVSAALYFLPVLVAALRRAPDLGSVAAVNVLLGWTLLGWVFALAMALRSTRWPGQVVQFVQNASAPPVSRYASALPPVRQAPPAGWAGPAGPPAGWAGPSGPAPGRAEDAPPLFLPPDCADLTGGFGPVGEE